MQSYDIKNVVSNNEMLANKKELKQFHLQHNNKYIIKSIFKA